MEAGRENGCVSVGGGTGCSCLPFTSALLYLSAAFPARIGRQKLFPLLCHYQEIIICCSVFHTDNQGWLPHGKFKNRTNNTFIYSMPLYQLLPWVAVVICFPKHINDISALAEIKSIHYDCAWAGTEVAWSRACCVSAKSCLRVHYFTQAEEPRL